MPTSMVAFAVVLIFSSGDTTATREQHNGTARWQHTRGETCRLRGEAMTTLVNSWSSCALACQATLVPPSSAQGGISTPRQSTKLSSSTTQSRGIDNCLVILSEPSSHTVQHQHLELICRPEKHPSAAGSGLRPSKPTIKTRLAADLLGSRTSNVEPLTFCYTTADNPHFNQHAPVASSCHMTMTVFCHPIICHPNVFSGTLCWHRSAPAGNPRANAHDSYAAGRECITVSRRRGMRGQLCFNVYPSSRRDRPRSLTWGCLSR